MSIRCGGQHYASPVVSLLPRRGIIDRAHGCRSLPRQRCPLESHVLILSSVAGCLVGRLQCRGRKRRIGLASGCTQLLVDGDSHNVDDIKLAIRCLEGHCGQKVCTTLFAAPNRCKNKKWGDFMRDHRLTFRPTHRHSSKTQAEPNDEAIIRTLRKSTASKLDRLALLTTDTDFVDTISELRDTFGINIFVLIPEHFVQTIQKFEVRGVKVLPVSFPHKASCSRVRATLRQDGSGLVELADPYEPIPDEIFRPKEDPVARFLQDLGYGEERTGFLVKKCVKFWAENQLGSLTVFPFQRPIVEVSDILAKSELAPTKSWKESSGRLAYFLPTGGPQGRLSKKDERHYRNRVSRGVYFGGGPFLLQDSSDLVVRVLRRLGFLDDEFNTDVPESMFLFINSAEHKKVLRKHGMLPSAGETYVDVGEKLRLAFLSDSTAATWQVMNKSDQKMKSILRILQKEKIFPAGNPSKYSIQETFEAMKLYATREKLPVFRTFNGLAWSIFRQNDTSPQTRPFVDFKR